MATINKEKLLSKERLEIAFKMFDIDGSGTISTKELKETFGNTISESIWKELVNEVDDNGDGEVDIYFYF
jgi:calcium-dependent protein kinase